MSPQLSQKDAQTLARTLESLAPILESLGRGPCTHQVSDKLHKELSELHRLADSVTPAVQALTKAVLVPANDEGVATLLIATSPTILFEPAQFLAELGANAETAYNRYVQRADKQNMAQLSAALGNVASTNGDAVHKCLLYLYLKTSSVNAIEIAAAMPDPVKTQFLDDVVNITRRGGVLADELTQNGKSILALMAVSSEHARRVLIEEQGAMALIYFNAAHKSHVTGLEFIRQIDKHLAKYGPNSLHHSALHTLTYQISPPSKYEREPAFVFKNPKELHDTFNGLQSNQIKALVIPWFSILGEYEDIAALRKVAKLNPELAKVCRTAIIELLSNDSSSLTQSQEILGFVRLAAHDLGTFIKTSLKQLVFGKKDV